MKNSEQPKMKIKTFTREDKEKVDEIVDTAKALGWSDQELYSSSGQFSFPTGRGWGLVCFLDKHTDIGEVTGEYIELIHHGEVTDAKTRYFKWSRYYPNWDKER